MGEQLELDIDTDTDTDMNGLIALNAKLVQILEKQTEERDLFSGRLWALEDVAYYLKVSPMTARRILDHDDAPVPLRLPTSRTGSRLTPRYQSDMMIRFLRSIGHP